MSRGASRQQCNIEYITKSWGLGLKAWSRLEKAEHDRERVLRDELIRQEKLEQMARRFDRKAAMRETWLLENQRLVAQVRINYARLLYSVPKVLTRRPFYLSSAG